jgi:hypothetical protein
MQQLTDEPGQQLGGQAWSPDGLRMSCFDFAHNISYIFDPNKPWEEQSPVALPPLSAEGMWFQAISWSPDGRWLAGNGFSVPGIHREIVIFSLETEQYRSLYPNGAFVLWLPDSHGLLFSTMEGALHKVDIDSGKSGEVLSLLPDLIWPTDFSPDQKWLYFTRQSSEADIWMLTLSEPR